VQGFRLLSGVFAALLVMPGALFLAAQMRGAAFVRPSDLALAGILLTASAVIFSALHARSRVALRASSAFCVGTGLVALVAAASSEAWPQDVALGGFLLAGATSLALAAGEPAQRTSTQPAKS
jgi:hypothetical protein